VAIPASGVAQQPPDSGAIQPTAQFVAMGGSAEDRARLAQLTGLSSTAGWLIRTSASMSEPLSASNSRAIRTSACRWAPILPNVGLTWNSGIPKAINSGGAWNGRGESGEVGAGVRATCGRLSVQVRPEIWFAANRDFAILSANSPGHSDFANPFHTGPGWSADIPIRMGAQPLLVIQPGQTSVELTVGPAAVGVGTESQWWGPGIRNAILMSNHAAGIPAVHIRTARPIATPVGLLEARGIAGILTQSPWFSKTKPNARRSLTGLVVTLRPALDTGLTIGVARVVFVEVAAVRRLALHLVDPVAVWGAAGDVRSDTTDRTDQLASAFARWVFPSAGAEVYGEWARVILPNSLRSLFLSPQFSQGFTVGLQWVSGPNDARSSIGAWRVQAEATNLEQQYESRAVKPPTYYVSPSVRAGYTQRGRVIGARIGPGSSSQFLAVDRLLARRSLGVALERVRWDNDAYYHAPTGVGVWAHDVSLIAGVRASQRFRFAEVTAEVDIEQRLNFLFQNANSGYSADRTYDVHNLSFRFQVQPVRLSR
jgi:hypothetical protein